MLKEHYQDGCDGICNKPWLHVDSTLCSDNCELDDGGFCWLHGIQSVHDKDSLDDYLCQTEYQPESISTRCDAVGQPNGIYGEPARARASQIRLNMEIDATRPDHAGAVVRKPRRQRIRK